MAPKRRRNQATMSTIRSHLFNRIRFTTFGAPRRPRHPFLRIALGLVGVALLLALLFVSVFVGIAMLAVGMLYRLWTHRRTPSLNRAGAARAGTVDGDAIDGTFRVVGKAQLPLAH